MGTGPLDRVDVEPAVAVEVDQAHAPRHGFGELFQGRSAVLKPEGQAGRPGVVRERDSRPCRPDRLAWGRGRGCRRDRVGRGRGDARAGRVEPREPLAQAGSLGAELEGQREERTGLEAPAQPFGLVGQAERVGLVVGRDAAGVDALDLVERGLAAAQLDGRLDPPGLNLQFGQAFEGREVGGLKVQQRPQRLGLGPWVPRPLRQPRAGPQAAFRGEPPGLQQLAQAGPRKPLVPSGRREVQGGRPDRRVAGPGREAEVEPARGLLEAAGAEGQPALAQPDPVVARSEPTGLVERRADALDRVRFEVERQVRPQDLDRSCRIRPLGAPGVLPVLFEEGPGLVEPARLPVDLEEFVPERDGLLAGALQRVEQDLLGPSEPAPVDLGPGPAEGGVLGERGGRRDPRPGRDGRVGVAEFVFAEAQGVLVLGPAGPPGGEPGEGVSRLGVAAFGQVATGSCVQGRAPPGHAGPARRERDGQPDDDPARQDSYAGRPADPGPFCFLDRHRRCTPAADLPS
ncbi:MAG: hypothetical protein U0835_12405 [Isosphaeraceae bacterium]